MVLGFLELIEEGGSMGRLRSPLFVSGGSLIDGGFYMSSRSLLLALRVPGRSFRGGKYAQVVIVVGASFFFCKCGRVLLVHGFILIRKFRRPRRDLRSFISLVYLAIQGGFLLWSLRQIQ
ncbi:hypothetical protein [Pseudomonas aeruginosa]|uniref:hypothetical protein n=1 Tax=Pseudomonas aeruginosa TaxID=287 RepID=UPI0021B1F6CC|nr:hypothetical protein [Pseudomonas aeruginosa]MCT7417843.1 hypothetical protein [Pseudomonas aeruginosa]